MMKSYGESVEICNSSNLRYIPHQHYIILIIGGSISDKTNETDVLVNLIKH